MTVLAKRTATNGATNTPNPAPPSPPPLLVWTNRSSRQKLAVALVTVLAVFTLTTQMMQTPQTVSFNSSSSELAVAAMSKRDDNQLFSIDWAWWKRWLQRRIKGYKPPPILFGDVLERSHCRQRFRFQVDMTSKQRNTLFAWANAVPIAMEELRPQLECAIEERRQRQSLTSGNETSQEALQRHLQNMRNEFTLQLWEMFLMEHNQCDFEKYQPTVAAGHDRQGQQLQAVTRNTRTIRTTQSNTSTSMAMVKPIMSLPRRKANKQQPYRLAFVITAFQDFAHLTALIKAIHLPQHYIVIHLEQSCPPEYRNQIDAWLNVSSTSSSTTTAPYNNVVVLQFGTIVYTTDSVSHINLRILRWLTLQLKLPYRQVILMNGSVYPLLSPTELVRHLEHESTVNRRSVWLGRLMMGPFDHVDYNAGTGTPKSSIRPNDSYLKLPRLIFTSSSSPDGIKLATGRVPGVTRSLPSRIHEHMIYKGTSGNQGVFGRHVVKQLLTSPTVMELFAYAKYSSFCCTEEHTWSAALSMIGYADEAMRYTSMFQVWGGSEECTGSMLNAVLTMNASHCYAISDPFYYNTTGKYAKKNRSGWFHFRGNETMAYLASAKQRGFLFARKFQSQSSESKHLMREIESKLWNE